MDFEAYMAAIERSSKADWITIEGNVFLGRSDAEVDEAHHSIATLRGDLSISIAVGLPHERVFKERWTGNDPDPNASSSWLDFLWNGRPVFRKLVVWVDGSRGLLPTPHLDDLSISAREARIFQVLNGLFAFDDFDRYSRSAGFKVEDRHWP